MKKEVIEIEVKGTGKAIEQTDKLKKSVKEVGTETKEVSKGSNELGGTLDRMTGGAVSKFKGMLTSIKAVSGGFNMMKIAIIGTGIGALLIAIIAVGKAFTNSEAGQNKFAKLMGVIGSVTGNLVDMLASLGEKIIWAFENPKKAINDFVKLLKDNVINRFNGLLELTPQLGKAVKQLFTGDFGGAAETAANAVAKVALGTNNLTQSIRDASVALKDMAKEIADDAKKAAVIADKRAKADKIERDLITERAQANRDIADLRLKSELKDKYAVTERIKFLKEANAIEEETTNKAIAAAVLRRDAIIAENKLSGSTKENLDEEANLKARVIDLDTAKLRLNKRLATRIIEFQNEEAAGIKKIADEKQKGIDAQKVIDDKKKVEDAKTEKERLDAIDAIQKEYKIKKEDEEAIDEIAKLELTKTRELAKLEALNATEEQRAAILTYWDNQITDQKKKNSDDATKKAKENKEKELNDERILQQQKIAIVGQTFGALASILGKNSAAGKAAAIAQATINTYQGITEVWSTKSTLPEPFATISRIASTATVLASGLSAVKSIKSQKLPAGASGGGMSSASAPSIPTMAQAQSPDFNIVGASETNQLANAIGGQTQQPVQAYVVSNDVTTGQALDRNIVEGASVG